MRNNPLLLFLLCLAVVWVVPRTRKGGWHLWPKVPATFLVVAFFALTAAGYVSINAYFDHVEPTVASVSWVVMRGEPSHPGPESIGTYGFAYGPMLYLINGLVMKGIGPGLAASKLAGVLAALASLAVLALALYRARGRGAEWSWGTSLTALLLLTFGATAFWVRAEPLLLLCSSVAILGLTLPPPAAVLTVGSALGLGLNLKVTAFIYLLPPLTMLWQRHRLPTLLGTCVVAGIVFALPYAASDAISMAGYRYWIEITATHGIRLRALPSMLQWAIFIMVPLFAVRGSNAASLLRPVLIGSVLASVALGAKHGTGSYHFVPFIPSIGFCAGLNFGGHARRGLLLASWLPAAVLVAAVQGQHWVRLTTSQPSREVVSELRAFEDKYGGPMAMGYGANYRASFYRPLLVFDGHPLVLDAAGLMDRHWTTMPFPPAAFDSLAACRVRTWLIPGGGAPFVLPTAYPREGLVVPDAFRRAFEDKYERVEGGAWLDVWRCR